MLLDDVRNIFSKYFTFSFIWEDVHTWLKFENELPCVPVEYTYFDIKYQNSYFREIYDSLENISIIISNGGGVAALWPLCLTSKDGKYNVSAWGGECLYEPLLCKNNLNNSTKRKFLSRCLDAITELCRQYKIDSFINKKLIMKEGISIWDQLLLENGAYCKKNTIECYLNLEQSENEIMKNIRRTNKYSIMKGYELFEDKIITKKDDSLLLRSTFDDFEKLHISIAMRRTRSHDTWECQLEAVQNSSDFVVMIYDCEVLIGASLFQTSGSFCNYAVAAYRRDYFDKPLAHISQWTAIKHMKELGIKWYYIGERPYQWTNPTEKEINIGHFKEGFATNLFNSIHLNYNFGGNF